MAVSKQNEGRTVVVVKTTSVPNTKPSPMGAVEYRGKVTFDPKTGLVVAISKAQ